jgi:hypothetical protein
MDDNPLRVQYGPIEGKEGFFTWLIGGENFGNTPGEFEGPFPTLDEARAAAEKAAEAKQLTVQHDPTG